MRFPAPDILTHVKEKSFNKNIICSETSEPRTITACKDGEFKLSEVRIALDYLHMNQSEQLPRRQFIGAYANQQHR